MSRLLDNLLLYHDTTLNCVSMQVLCALGLFFFAGSCVASDQPVWGCLEHCAKVPFGIARTPSGLCLIPSSRELLGLLIDGCLFMLILL